MKSFISALAVCLVAGVGSAGAQQPLQQQQQTQSQQEKPTPAVDPAFEGCLAKSTTEGVFLLTNARAVAGTIVGTGLRFRVMADNKGIDLLPHVNHVVQVSGPVEGAVPPVGKPIPEPELPQIRVKGLSMISSECI